VVDRYEGGKQVVVAGR